jgi:Gas vesicle protein G
VIIFKLLALPVTAPMAGIRFCLDKVVEFAENEMNDEEPVKEALLELALDLEEGRIDDASYREREAELLARLREIREYAKQRARESVEASAPAEGEERTVVIELPEELR